MKKAIIIFVSILFSACIYSQVKTIQERLGYPKDAKLVIIHADDSLAKSHLDANHVAIDAPIVIFLVSLRAF